MQHYALFRLHKWKCLGVVIPYPTRCCNSIITLSWWHKNCRLVGDISCPLVNLNAAKIGKNPETCKDFPEKIT